MTAVGIGELDRKISLYSPVTTLDTSGRAVVNSTVLKGQVFAKLEESDDVRLADEGYLDEVTVKATIYKMTGLNTTWTADLGDYCTYEIIAIDQISRISPFCILTLRRKNPTYGLV